MAFKINKNWIVLLVALVVGGIAAYGAQNYLSGRIAQIEERDKNRATVKLVVPKDTLEKGAVLSGQAVAIRAIPAEWAPSGGITPDQFGRAEGVALAYPVNAGEPLLWAHLEGKRAPSFSSRLSQGRRAVTVPVDEISSLSGMVEPGDLIDIVVSVNKNSRNFTFTLLQSVTVLATGTQDAPGNSREGGKKTFTAITLDTVPEDAKRIIAAREVGRVTALLRAPGDKARVSASRSDAQALLGLGSASASSSVPVIYGGRPIGEVERLNAPRFRDDETAALPAKP